MNNATTCTSMDLPSLPSMRHGKRGEGGLESPRWFWLSDTNAPHGPHSVAGLKDLFREGHIRNHTRVWTTEGGESTWKEVAELPSLKHALYGLPPLPLLRAPGDRRAPDDSQRWFFVENDMARVAGPVAVDSLRERFENKVASDDMVVIDDSTLAYTAGMTDWEAIDKLFDGDDNAMGTPGGWKRRSDHEARPLRRFDVSYACSTCGTVATLHSPDALGSMKRSPPPSGRPAAGRHASTRDMAEVLPDFLWIGNFNSSRAPALKATLLSHVINCTTDIADALKPRDMTEVPEGSSRANGKKDGNAAMCYLRLPVPDVIDADFLSAATPPDEHANDDRRAEMKRALDQQKMRGLDEEGWLICFDRLYDFADNALRLCGALCRILIHSRRGSLRAEVAAASFLIRRYGLRAAEALAHVEKHQGRLKFVGANLLTRGATTALRQYEERHSLGRLFCEPCFERHRLAGAPEPSGSGEGGALSVADGSAMRRLQSGSGDFEELELRGEPLHDVRSLGTLAAAVATTASPLVVLDLSGTGLGEAESRAMGNGAAAAFCASIAVCRTIEVMVLQYARIDDTAAGRIAALLSYDEGGDAHPLALLDLSFNDIGQQGAEALSRALHLNESLTSLDMQSNRIGDAGGLAFAKVLCDPDTDLHLKALMMGEASTSPYPARLPTTAAAATTTTTTTAAEAFLGRHKRNAGLTSLNISSNGCEEACMRQLCEVARVNPTMVGLELAFNPLLSNGAVLDFIEAIVSYAPPLEVLSISQLSFSEDVAMAMGRMLAARDSSIRCLALPCNHMRSAAAGHLARSLRSNVSLTSLKLAQNPFGTKGSHHLSAMLECNAAVTRLDLEACGFGEESARALGQALADNRVLRSLNLSENHFGPHGVKGFARALRCNQTLATLRMDGVRAGVVGGEFLARALAENSTLTDFSFSNNSIRNIGAKAFAAALGQNDTLRRIDLGFNDFDASGGAAITAALATEPGCGSAKMAISLHCSLTGNRGCEALIPPHLARSKLRMDF